MISEGHANNQALKGKKYRNHTQIPQNGYGSRGLCKQNNPAIVMLAAANRRKTDILLLPGEKPCAVSALTRYAFNVMPNRPVADMTGQTG